ncbi:MAG: hypothetical protein ACI84C_002928, partial [Flavobacteriales bacterium]
NGNETQSYLVYGPGIHGLITETYNASQNSSFSVAVAIHANTNPPLSCPKTYTMDLIQPRFPPNLYHTCATECLGLTGAVLIDPVISGSLHDHYDIV